MSYCTASYYDSVYFGESAGDRFDRLAARASDDIDIAARFQVNLAALPAAHRDLVAKATAAQIEWYVLNGDTYNDQGDTESIGSYSRTGGKSAVTGKPAALCPRARAYLEQTGLLNRTVSVIDSTSSLEEDQE